MKQSMNDIGLSWEPESLPFGARLYSAPCISACAAEGVPVPPN